MKVGVLYHFSGLPYTAALICSIHELRKYYGGPICIAALPECFDVAQRLASCPKLRCLVTPTEVIFRTIKKHWMSKLCTFIASPFERTVFMDADTIWNRDCCDTELFKGAGLVLTELNGQRLGDETAIARSLLDRMSYLNDYGPVLSRDFKAAVESKPLLINTGVMAWDKGHPLITRLHDVMLAVRTSHTASDETVMQMLIGIDAGSRRDAETDLSVLNSRYNWISRRTSEKDIAIRHFTRRNWYLRERDEYAESLRYAREKNAGFISDWLPQCFTPVNLV